jgi:hypothetical protein
MYKCILTSCIFFAISCAIFAQTPNNQNSDAGASSKTDSPFSQNKYVPDISFILDFSGVGRNISDEKMKEMVTPGYKNTSTAAGSPLVEREQGSNTNRGFNLNYGEMSVASTIDPYLDMLAVLTFSAEGVEVEEGYFKTRSLPLGLQIRAGKFKSAFGRVNEQHEHAWDFADQPRIYDAFFSEEGLNEKGVRLSWLAPLPFYLLVGGEAFQGENQGSFGRDGFGDVNGSVSVRSSRVPNVYTGYVKFSFDFDDLVFLVGLSNVYGKTRINQGLDDAGTAGSALHSTTDIAGADVTIKYLVDSYRYISLQSEYLYRYMNGKGYDKDAGDAVTKYDVRKKQSGLYSQLLVRFAERWRIGLRYELLQKNDTYRDSVKDHAPANLPKYSAMIDFNPSEFSRIRVQYNYDRTGYLPSNGGYNLKPNHEVILQCNMAIGSHGAHSF